MYGTCSTSVVQPEMKVEWQEEITKVLLLSTERSKRKHSTYTKHTGAANHLYTFAVADTHREPGRLQR